MQMRKRGNQEEDEHGSHKSMKHAVSHALPHAPAEAPVSQLRKPNPEVQGYGLQWGGY